MPATKKNKKVANKKTFAIVDPSVGNYEKHPFFIKKANEAKALIKKAGMPKEFYEKK
jgi:hypothetical protein